MSLLCCCKVCKVFEKLALCWSQLILYPWDEDILYIVMSYSKHKMNILKPNWKMQYIPLFARLPITCPRLSDILYNTTRRPLLVWGQDLGWVTDLLDLHQVKGVTRGPMIIPNLGEVIPGLPNMLKNIKTIWTIFGYWLKEPFWKSGLEFFRICFLCKILAPLCYIFCI